MRYIATDLGDVDTEYNLDSEWIPDWEVDMVEDTDDEWDSASDSYSDMDEDAIDLSVDNPGNTFLRRPTLKTLPRTDNPENIILKRRRHCQMAERYVCNIENA